MSDIKLFRIGQGHVSELSGTTDTIEKSLQTLCEKNLEALLGVRFVASEFTKIGNRRVAGEKDCAQRVGVGHNHDIKDASAAALRFGGGADQRMLFGGIVVPRVDGNAG